MSAEGRPVLGVGRRRRSTPATPSAVYAAVTIAWLGFVLHNVADLPMQSLTSPETLWPTVVTGALVLAYALGLKRVATVGLFCWAGLHLVGGAASVLPLPILPFQPEQTLRHYSFHLLYAATQLPLLVVSWRSLRGRTHPA